MVTLDLPACISIGAAVALRNRTNPAPLSALRLRALALTLFGLTPLAQLFLSYYPDWEWQYFFESRPWMQMAFVLALNGLGLAGFELARRASQRGATVVVVVPLVVCALSVALWHERVFWVGTTAEWLGGRAAFMPTLVPFQALLGGSTVYLALVLFLGLRRPVATN